MIKSTVTDCKKAANKKGGQSLKDVAYFSPPKKYIISGPSKIEKNTIIASMPM